MQSMALQIQDRPRKEDNEEDKRCRCSDRGGDEGFGGTY